jgi:hypothetical protein
VFSAGLQPTQRASLDRLLVQVIRDTEREPGANAKRADFVEEAAHCAAA